MNDGFPCACRFKREPDWPYDGSGNEQIETCAFHASQSCEGERYRKALEEIAKQKLSCQLIPGDVDFEGGYDCCVKRARGALCDITSDLVSEEQPPDTCPECHGTGKTVINKHIGVENCPECGRDSEGLATCDHKNKGGVWFDCDNEPHCMNCAEIVPK